MTDRPRTVLVVLPAAVDAHLAGTVGASCDHDRVRAEVNRAPRRAATAKAE